MYQSNFGETKQNNVIVCPNFCELASFEILKQNGIRLGAQNVSAFENGPHTAEITPLMLKKFGVEFCIVGHSERRKDFAETHAEISQKIILLQKNNITPILCVGESLSESVPQIDWAKQVVDEQLGKELVGVNKDNLIVAYEPVWAIGAGKTADNEHISNVCEHIKNRFGIKTVLYGGSVNAENICQIAQTKCVDGVLIGKASLDSKNLLDMQKKLSE